jgi:hypothetical protein
MLPWSIIVDYISLFKTRVILRILTKIQVRAMVSAIAILVMDYIIYRIIFAFATLAAATLAYYIT